MPYIAAAAEEMIINHRITTIILVLWFVFILAMTTLRVKSTLGELKRRLATSLLRDGRVAPEPDNLAMAIERTRDFLAHVPEDKVLVAFRSELRPGPSGYALFELRTNLYPKRLDAATLDHELGLRRVRFVRGGYELVPMDAAQYRYVLVIGTPA